jgi:hypothetical protein
MLRGADVRAHPTGGFSPAASAFGCFVFTPKSGPPVLFQPSAEAVTLAEADVRP